MRTHPVTTQSTATTAHFLNETGWNQDYTLSYLPCPRVSFKSHINIFINPALTESLLPQDLPVRRVTQ